METNVITTERRLSGESWCDRTIKGMTRADPVIIAIMNRVTVSATREVFWYVRSQLAIALLSAFIRPCSSSSARSFRRLKANQSRRRPFRRKCWTGSLEFWRRGRSTRSIRVLNFSKAWRSCLALDWLVLSAREKVSMLMTVLKASRDSSTWSAGCQSFVDDLLTVLFDQTPKAQNRSFVYYVLHFHPLAILPSLLQAKSIDYVLATEWLN